MIGEDLPTFLATTGLRPAHLHQFSTHPHQRAPNSLIAESVSLHPVFSSRVGTGAGLHTETTQIANRYWR
jgi:hypothetical protein